MRRKRLAVLPSGSASKATPRIHGLNVSESKYRLVRIGWSHLSIWAVQGVDSACAQGLTNAR